MNANAKLPHCRPKNRATYVKIVSDFWRAHDAKRPAAAAAGAAKKDLFVTTRSHSVKSDVSDFLGLIAKEAQNRWAASCLVYYRATGAKGEGLFVIEIRTGHH